MRLVLAATLLLTMTQLASSQSYYKTVLGKAVIIQEDYSVTAPPAEEGAYSSTDHPFELPAGETYVIDNQELLQINKLKAEANEREIHSYIKWLQSRQDTLADSRQAIKRYQDAKGISGLIAKLDKTDEVGRQQLYISINESVKDLQPNAYTIPLQDKPAMEADIRSDTRTAYDIIHKDACAIVYDDYDPALGAQRKETHAELLLGYTQPSLRRHFVDGDYITAHASMARIDGDYYLLLKIVIQSKSASKNYGAILPDERLRLRLVDGTSVYGTPTNRQLGTLQEYTGHTIYKPMIKLHKDDIKRLQKIEMDDIGIVWTTGFENYEVYHVDVLKRLVTCLKQ